MSGHSKWSSIKHQKAVADSRRGAVFTKLANLITVAARQGGGDPEMNFKLRLAIAKAKAANLPTTNVERAIAKGTGASGGALVEEILYEGYGPGGVAILVEVATDNRNRAASDVRSAFTKHGGRLAEAGAVKFQFDQKGIIELGESGEVAELAAIEAGADDIATEDGKLVVSTQPTKLETVRAELVAGGHPVNSAELSFVPRQTVTVSDQKVASQLLRIMETLDELDDVSETYANFELPEDAS